jgi:hypothetical protein
MNDKVVGDEQSEYERHSFVIKIWLEDSDDSSHQAKWRGQITHVGDQEKRYVESLHDITSFIRGYLIRMGARVE